MLTWAPGAESQAAAAPGDDPVTGTIFIDFDRDGRLDAGEGVGQGSGFWPPNGVTVTAYDVDGNSVAGTVNPGTATTAATYSIDPTSLVGQDYRIEFTLNAADEALGFSDTQLGADSRTDVQMVTAGDDVSWGLVPPSQCPTEGVGADANVNVESGKIWTTCFVNGDRDGGGPQDVLVGLNYDNTGSVEHISDKPTLGAIWGIGYDEWDGLLFTSAYLKRHSELGDADGDTVGDLDGLWWFEYPSEVPSSIALESLGGSAFGSIGARDADTQVFNEPGHDPEAFALVSKAGIGDIDVTPDGKTLLVSNLAARSLMAYDISALPGGAISYVGEYAFTDADLSCAVDPGDWAIFAIEPIDSSRAYVGGVCTAQTSQDANGVDAKLLEVSFSLVGGNGAVAPTGVNSVVLEFGLDYYRTANTTTVACPGSDSPFVPWIDSWDDMAFGFFNNNGNPVNYACEHQPVFSDINIEVDGSLTLQFLDRTGDQIGAGNFDVEPGGPDDAYTVNTTGEMIKVCNTSGDPDVPTYVIEGGAGCEATMFTGVEHYGISGEAEFYGAEEWAGHNETIQGGAWDHPAYGNIVTAAMDPTNFASGGLEWFDLDDGTTTDARMLYFGGLASGGFARGGLLGKASGIGDVQGCFLPVEIGDVVWLDADGDGVQDPGELPLAGATVSIVVNGVTVTTTTDANGQWSFDSSDGLLANTGYTVTVDPSTNTTPLPAGFTNADLDETVTGAGSFEQDSNVVAGQIAVTTPDSGMSDHSFDAGYSLPLWDLSLIKTRSAGQGYNVDLSASPVTASFDITVVNQGWRSAANIAVVDYVPSGMAYYVAGAAAMPTLTANGVAVVVTDNSDGTFVIDSLAASDSVTFTVVMEVTSLAGSPFVNGAEISSFTDVNGDPQTDVDSTPDAIDDDPAISNPDDPDNETNSHNDPLYDPDGDGDVNEATPGDEDDHDYEVVAVTHDLALAKALDPSWSPGAGWLTPGSSTVDFAITVTNQGAPVQSITVVDYVQAGLVFDPADNAMLQVADTSGDLYDVTWAGAAGAATPTASIVSAAGGSFAVGEELTIIVTLTVDAAYAGGGLVNWAEISNFDANTDAGDGDAASGAWSDADSTPNQSQGDDVQPSGPGSPGDDVITGDGSGADPVTGDEDDHDVAGLPIYDLSLIKERAAGQNYVVDLSNTPPTISFDITVSNQGSADAFLIGVSDYLPAGTVYTTGAAPVMPTLTANGNAVTVTDNADGTFVIDRLAAGDMTTFAITLDIVDWSHGTYANGAEITGFDNNANAGDVLSAWVVDVDSTPDATDSDDLLVNPDDPDNENNSHNDIAYDHDGDGNLNEATPGDEDDHDREVVVIDYLPAIDIEKDTNGFQADTGTGPLVLANDAVVWTFVVTNTGNIDLADVRVTDTVTTDNGTAADPDGVVCDWATSTDAATPARNLSVGESVACTSSSTAALGQYTNNSDVVGTPVADAATANPDAPVRLTDGAGDPIADVVDEDPSAYFGPNASIDIEKDTNGNQADLVIDQDVYEIGDDIVWTFVVTNDGNVDLANVRVTDTVTTDNGTALDPDGIVCDWAASTDAATPAGNLSVGEQVTCTMSSTAEAGQYANNADVVGTPVADAVTADPAAPTPIQDWEGNDLVDVVDEDPSHYYATPRPSIDIEKDTNGTQADVVGDQDYIAIGDDVVWTFVVTNDGNVDLADVVVTDSVVIDNGTVADPNGVVCDWATSTDPLTPARNLSVGEQVTCTSSSTAVVGQYGNNADVVGTPVADASTADPDAPVVLENENGDPIADVVDEDPSHYYGLVMPAIDIEKDTNGFQADTGDGPMIVEGEDVTWTFVVTNTGNVALGNVTVTDVVTVDNGTTPDPDGVVCDWANSSDAATAANILSVGETVTCTAASTAELGFYKNDSSVVGSPLANDGTPLLDDEGMPVPNVTDEDPSAYFGPDPSIDIEKDTNGNQADVLAYQDVYSIGDPITWTFVVTNDGNVDLANVRVTDSVTTDNGTAPDPAGVVCDWASSTDPVTPAGNLSVGEQVTCTSSSFAEAGQYANLSDVVGTPVDDAVTADPVNPTPLTDHTGAMLVDVVDEDPSHYHADPEPAIDIEKDTNGTQADLIDDQDIVGVGNPVTWTFQVVNTGNVDLADVVVTDTVTIDNGTAADPAGVVCDWALSSDPATPARNLSVGETVTCTSSSSAAQGQYGNLADVVGTPVADATTADPDDPTPLADINGDPIADVVDEDPSHYYGDSAPAIDIEKDTNGHQADTGTGPVIFEGDAVVWTFVVTNTGTIPLGDVTVTDTVTLDNGTALDPNGVVCDWANSTDPATDVGELSVLEQVTCTSSSTAELGQYRNVADVVGTPLAADGNPLLDENGDPVPNVVDEDPSAYFGPDPAIDIEKDTNGNQADALSDQDILAIGEDVTWTFVVTNTGNVDLASIRVADVVTTDNGTAVDPAGIVCDWTSSTDGLTPAGNLSVGESVACTMASEAEAGQYANLSDVVGTPVADAATADPFNPVALTDENGVELADVVDEDPSHYYALPEPSIDLEKDTNGNQADTPETQDVVGLGNAVVWTFVIVNDGNVDLADVQILDSVTIDNGTPPDVDGVVCDWANSSDAATPARNLSVGETVTCTSSSTAAAGQYRNDAFVTGSPVADATTADPDDHTPLLGPDGLPIPRVNDDDPSHYYGDNTPAIDIEKDTNGHQADTGSGPVIFEGDAVTWTFVVTNTGTVPLGNVTVTDTVTVDNGTVADAVVCDWPNSTDSLTGANTLSVGEQVTCVARSTAELGQYKNLAEVVGTPLANDGTPLRDEFGDPVPPVSDDDPSAYFGPDASIDIEKFTNGNQADTTATQDNLAVGELVTWTFEIVNAGNVDLAGVNVADVVTIDNGTSSDPDGVTCDWLASSDPATPARNLSVGETVTCMMLGSAEAGQYGNNAGVVGTPVDDATTADPFRPVPMVDDSGDPLADVVDTDPSHYFGVAAPSIDIEKFTNGVDADNADNPAYVEQGDDVVWTFVVTNDGNVDLAGVDVTDTVIIDNGTAPDPNGLVCDWASSTDPLTPAGNLSVGEQVTCAARSTAVADLHGNLGQVTGTPVDDAQDPTPNRLFDEGDNPIPNVVDDDPSHYVGPILDLALRKTLPDGSNDTAVELGDVVTFVIDVFNQGNVPAGNIELIDYLPSHLELADPDWTMDGGGALISLGDLTLDPGEQTRVEITVRVVDADANAPTDLDVPAEIADAVGVHGNGDPIYMVAADGSTELLADIDSTPDRTNSEDPVEDEIHNADGDEDDHDPVRVTIAARPTTPPSAPPAGPGVPQLEYTPFTNAPGGSPPEPALPSGPLAFTGTETRTLTALGALLVLTGASLTMISRRRSDEQEKEGRKFG